MNKSILILSLVLLISIQSNLSTCTCIGERTLDEMKYDSYDVVFEGKLIQKAVFSLEGEKVEMDSMIWEIRSNYYYKYTFEVNIIYESIKFNNFFITVYSKYSKGSCGINLALNKNYIVMSNYGVIEPILEYNTLKLITTDELKLNLITNRCTHTRETNKMDLEKLDSIFYQKVLVNRVEIINK